MSKYEKIFDNFISSVIRTLNADEIYDVFMDALKLALPADGLLLMMNRSAGHTFKTVRSYGYITTRKNFSTLTDSQLAHLMSAPNFISISENTNSVSSILSQRQQKWLITENITAFYTIKYSNVIIGFVYISGCKKFTRAMQNCLKKLCYHFSYAMRNANLYQTAYRASITDDLTSLYNRKYAIECIENTCSLKNPAALILLDIDDFRLYNELYGSNEGDILISRCAQVLLRELSSKEMVFRFGTDEFLILKEGNSETDAVSFCHEIVEKIVHSIPTNIVWDMTITCGVSTFPDISKDALSFLHNAEQAVYYGKKESKGSVEVYRREMNERSHNPDFRTAYERSAPTIYALTAAIDAKDTFTFVHSLNVSKYAVTLAQSLGMSGSDIEIIREAALLHDIGKISIPEHILQKTSRLTDEEYAIMKTHAENSTKIIRYLPDMDYVIPAVVGHHERYDGKGYPRGLAGESIPYMARILSVADCFDAMTARRPYKPPRSVEYAVSELERNSGTQFDPALVKKFVELIHTGKIVVS